MTKHRRSVLGSLLLIVLIVTFLSGCSNGNLVESAPSGTIITKAVPTNTIEPTVVPMDVPTAVSSTSQPDVTAEPTPTPTVQSTFDMTQRNSMSMLNYLAVLTQEINASKNSRLYLEEAYSSLINNTHPNAIDDSTHDHLAYILDTLENYRMIAVKRDRLQYIYEQNRAQALRAAIPNPLGLLSAVQSFDLKKIVASVVYMAVDSYTSYTAFTAQNDLQYIKDGWVLDDEEATALHNIRKETFSYMVETVNSYDLPGDLALNENAVDEFVFWKNNTNKVQRILFLESNLETYGAFGAYWLTLAESYYENGDYDKCLGAISAYKAIQTRIFRKDYALAKVLPLAIVSANEEKPAAEYIDLADRFAEGILANTDNTDWSLRYFAAQTFVELYAKSNDLRFLQRAYTVTLGNVNYLVNKQKVMNAEYLSPLVEAVVPKDATKEEKATIDNYYKQIKEERATALTPVYEPLLLNCELLFSLANELEISAIEKAKVDGILHENGENIFLIPSLDNLYRFSPPSEKTANDGINLSFNGKEIIIPSKNVADDARITVTIAAPSAEPPVVIEDWALIKVERKDDNNIDTFSATFKSPTAEKHRYLADSEITIMVVPKSNSAAGALSFTYKTVGTKEQWWEFVKVWEGDISFESVSE